jgi:hypothetical protein
LYGTNQKRRASFIQITIIPRSNGLRAIELGLLYHRSGKDKKRNGLVRVNDTASSCSVGREIQVEFSPEKLRVCVKGTAERCLQGRDG